MIKNSLKDVEMSDKVEESGKGLSILISSSYNHHSNWMAYSCWYSIYKNLPEAKVAITVGRPSNNENYYYHWVYKHNDLRYSLHKNYNHQLKSNYINKLFGTYLALKEGLVKQPLLVLDCDMVAIESLNPEVVKVLNNVKFATNKCPYGLNFDGNSVGPIWYFNNIPLEKIEESINTLKTLKEKDHIDLLSLSKVFGEEVTVIEELGDDVKSKKLVTFAHFFNGCGNFTKKDWEKGKTVPPFNVAYALYVVDTTVNEKKVLGLWSQMANLWDLVNQIRT